MTTAAGDGGSPPRRPWVGGAKAVGLALSAVCCWWVGRELVGRYHELQPQLDWARLALPLLGGVGLWVGVNACLGLAWWQWILMAGESVTWRDAVVLACRVQVAKYLPGNVFHYAGRVVLAKRIGISAKAAAGAALLEPVLLLAVAGLVAMRVWLRLPMASWVVPAGGLSLLLMAWATRALWWSRWAAWRARVQFSFGGVAVAVGAAMAVFVLQTLMFVWIERALGMGQVRGLGATFEMVTASWAAGFVVVGSPGGLGVREFVLTLLAGPDELSAIVLVAALTRLCAMVGDVVSLLVGLLLPLRGSGGSSS